MKRRNPAARHAERRAIAVEAARLMLEEGLTEYYEAKRVAADNLGDFGRASLPSNRQIRAAIIALTSIDAEARRRHLQKLRAVAVEVMEHLVMFDPRLIGSVASGAVHAGSDVDLHVFVVDHARLEATLASAGWEAERAERPVLKDGRLTLYVHYRFEWRDVPVELSVYDPAELSRVSLSSIDHKPIDRVPLNRVRRLMESG